MKALPRPHSKDRDYYSKDREYYSKGRDYDSRDYAASSYSTQEDYRALKKTIGHSKEDYRVLKRRL